MGDADAQQADVDPGKAVQGLLSLLPDLESAEWVAEGDDGQTTRFFFSKLPATKQLPAMEILRTSIGRMNFRLELVQGLGDIFAIFMDAIVRMPEDAVERLMPLMFEGVKYVNKHNEKAVPGGNRVRGDEDNAFRGLDAFAIYEVLSRALAVNFARPFFNRASKLPGLGELLGALFPSE